MEPPLFFAPPENIADGIITLPSAEARHAVTILRLKLAAMVVVVDGLGNAFRGELKHATSRKVTVRVHAENRNFGEPSVRLTLAAGLSAGHKFDTTVQKGTELGVKRFVPILAEKSRIRIEDPKRVRARVKRLERVALAAMKQCRRAYRPDIAAPTDLAQFLNEQDDLDIKLVFHPSIPAKPLSQLEIPSDTKRLTLLVGPESGFSEDEIEKAGEARFIPVSMGKRVLRTETAGPVAVALIMQKLGEFS